MRAAALLSPEEEMGDATGTRDRFDVKPFEQMVVVSRETLTFAGVEWSNGDVHFVDQIRLENRPHRRDPSADADIFPLSRLFCDLQRLARTGVEKVKRGVAEAERGPDMMREDEHGRMKWWIVTPPSLPSIVFHAPRWGPNVFRPMISAPMR